MQKATKCEHAPACGYTVLAIVIYFKINLIQFKMKPWKQIKIFTCDVEQSAIIEPNENQDGILFHACEENDKNKSFQLYMTKDEAIVIGEELIKYAQSL